MICVTVQRPRTSETELKYSDVKRAHMHTCTHVHTNTHININTNIQLHHAALSTCPAVMIALVDDAQENVNEHEDGIMRCSKNYQIYVSPTRFGLQTPQTILLFTLVVSCEPSSSTPESDNRGWVKEQFRDCVGVLESPPLDGRRSTPQTPARKSPARPRPSSNPRTTVPIC